jgi:hypothetical protein
MPTTGRLYALDVNGVVDERRDPIASTRAAARFTYRHNYEMLDTRGRSRSRRTTTGRTACRRAIRETGTTDIGTIV